MTEANKRPKDAAGWDARYVNDELPWDTGAPDVHLVRAVTELGIAPGKALDIGCGTGTNALWLAQRGFDVVGVDLSSTAIERARAKIEAAGAQCALHAVDFLKESVSGGPFSLIYDRGCFHVFDSAEDRARFAGRVAALLHADGVWRSVIGSTEGPPRDSGPPRLSASDVIAAVEPHLEILSIESASFDDGRLAHARAWLLVARPRPVAASES